MRFATDSKVSIATGIAAVGIILVAAVAARSASKFVDDAHWVARAHDARAVLQALDNHVDHTTEGVNAFLITGDSVYLRRYRSSQDSVRQDLALLPRLIREDSGSARALDSLGNLVSASAEELRRTLAAPPASPSSIRETAAHIAANAMIVERIEKIVHGLDERENGLLGERALSQRSREQIVGFAVVLLAAASIGIALTARRSIRRDLEARSRIEQALRASEAKFAGILDIAADGIISINERQEIVIFNRGAEQIFGYAARDVIGKPLECLLPQRFAGAHRQRVAQFGLSPEFAHYVDGRPQVIGRRRGGEEFIAEASISKLPTAEGMLFTVLLRDVTERHRVERREHALAEAGSRLAVPLDLDARLATVAQLPVPTVGAWCILDIVEESDGGGTTLRRVASSHPDPEIHAALHALAARGLGADSPERVIDVLRTGQSEIVSYASNGWFEAHTLDADHLALWSRLGSESLLFVPLRVDGRTIGAMTIGGAPGQSFGPDDLQLPEALAERGALAIDGARHLHRAERATAARDRVLGMVSHDLGNSLSAITMSAQSLLASSPAPSEPQRHVAQNILDAAAWMQRLMQDLLDVASIEAGHLSLEIQSEAIVPVIEATREMFAARARAQGVSLSVDVPPRLPQVRADAERVVQVLANLVGNALKYTGPGGTITIDARNGGPEILLAVRDTGAGIAARDVARVFDRFWYAKGRSNTRGTGLGLAIAQGIVVAHGGRIWVESEVGTGSTFFFTLPVAAT